MKKFLIAIIFLIPVIVFVAIQGAGSVIEAWAPSVNAERIEIRDQFNHNISDGRLVMPRYTYEGEDGVAYVYINVYPSVAFSDEIHYTVSEETDYKGQCVMERVEGAKYKITAQKSGDVLLRIYSATNDNAYRMLNVYITSNYVNDLSIYSQTQNQSQRNEEGEELVFEYGLKLYAFAYPIEAVGDNVISWQSNNEDIVKVDANGKIMAEGVGRAKVTATLTDNTDTEHFTFVFINVYEDIIFKKMEVYLNREFFEGLDQFEKERYVFENLVVENKQNPIDYDDVFLIENDIDTYLYEVRENQIVINLIDEDELLITSDFLQDIYLNNGGYTITVAYKDFNAGSIQNIAYNISDKSVMEIKDGLIEPKTKGVCDVYAKDLLTGKTSKAIRLEVKERAISFQLKSTNMDNLKGIKQERVWAMNWMKGEALTNTYSFGYDKATVYPQNADIELLWTVNNTDYAEIDNKGKISFKPQSIGNDVEVTATVMVHNIMTDMQRAYTFKMVDNIGAVNVYSGDEFKKVIEKGALERGAVVQKDLDMINQEIDITNSIYGNGYLLRFDYDDSMGTNDDALTLEGSNIDESLDELVLENFTIQCGAEYKFGQDKGNAIYLKELETKTVIRNIIARYAWNSLHLANNHADIIVEGSILGNAGFAAIYIAYDYYEKNEIKEKVTLKNLVFRETDCASLIVAPLSMKTDVTDKNYVPDIVIDGFIDSYNWKKTEDLKKMFEGLEGSMFGDLSSIKPFMDSLMEELLNNILTDEQNSRIVYTDEKGENWVSMNMFSVGLNQYIDYDSFKFENNNDFDIVPVYLPSFLINSLRYFIKFKLDHPCYFMIYKFDDENNPKIKPQDACPENEQLFNRLRAE